MLCAGEAWTFGLGGDGGRQGYQAGPGSAAQLWRPGQHFPAVGLWCPTLLKCRTTTFHAMSKRRVAKLQCVGVFRCRTQNMFSAVSTTF